MTKDEYKLLGEHDRHLVAQGYIDGFTSAVEQVRTTRIVSHDDVIDQESKEIIATVAKLLEQTLETLKNEQLALESMG